MDFYLGRRYGTIYAITVRHPSTGRPVLGYVGKTTYRDVEVRINQHRRSKPWAADIIGYRVLWRSNSCTWLTLWWAEVWRIVLYRPIYNYQWGRLNPRRIPIYQQRRPHGPRREDPRRAGVPGARPVPGRHHRLLRPAGAPHPTRRPRP